MFQTILLAVDGSEHSKKAIDVVKGMAPTFDSDVVVLHVREKVAVRGRLYDAYEEEEDSTGLTVADLKNAGAKTRVLEATALHGEVARKIVDAAEGVGADVVAMGTRGLSDAAGVFLGSVAHKVLHLAPCPVLITR